MAKSGLKSENPDNPKKRGGQRLFSDNSVGSRILVALDGRSRKWLSEATGISESTVSDCIANGIAKADAAVAIATALDLSLDYLLKGQQRAAGRADLVDADDADWVDVAEYDLRELTDESRGPIVSTTPFRKDWLNRTLGQSSGIWLARLPADLPRYDLREGEVVFLRDLHPGEAQDGAIYIVRVLGALTVVQLDALSDAMWQSVDRNLSDRRLAFRHIGQEDGKVVLVARVLGVPIKRL